MTFFDFLKELNDTAKDRLKTPITGAFVFSFLIYNWRPIALLSFSEASIEDKIVVINHEYCNRWSILIPFFIALIYTIIVPILSVLIDRLLISTKKARIMNIYASKTKTVEEKIELAKKEFQLKNIETGNKQIEDFQTQIHTLEQTKIQQIETHNTVVKQLNDELSEANNIILKLNESNNRLNETIDSQRVLLEHPEEFKARMMNVVVNGKGEVEIINSEDSDFYKSAVNSGLFTISNSDNKIVITDKGRSFRRLAKKEFNRSKENNSL